jgi:hypothetical protein
MCQMKRALALKDFLADKLAKLERSHLAEKMSLVRDERHDRMDKENDHSRKHGQRDSFIDACAANHCYDFHIFPIRTTVRVLLCHPALLC